MLILSQISLYFSSKSISFMKKDIYFVSSKFLIHAVVSGSIIHKSITFSWSSLCLRRCLKPFFTKRNLVRYYYFINVYIIYWNWTFVLVKFVFFKFNIAKSYNLFSHFTCSRKFFGFYNTSFSSVKSAFCIKFTALFLLIPLINNNQHPEC